MPPPRRLIHSEWFDHALQRLGDLRNVEDVLAKELYRLACYAELVPLAPGATSLRIYQTAPVLGEDGTVLRILIYFVLQEGGDAVELQHIEAIAEETG